jgi:hypothetical protein
MNSWRSWFHHLLDSCKERFPPPCLLAVALVLLSADLFLALTSYIKFSIMHLKDCNDNFSLFHQNSMTSAPIIKNKNKNINMEDQILNQKLNLEIIST